MGFRLIPNLNLNLIEALRKIRLMIKIRAEKKFEGWTVFVQPPSLGCSHNYETYKRHPNGTHPQPVQALLPQAWAASDESRGVVVSSDARGGGQCL